MSLLLGVVLTIFLTQKSNGQYQGILINGYNGTQLYDPFNAPHAYGNLQLGLSLGNHALGATAVMNGQNAYFLGGTSGE
jgi:hypothetical protein